MLRHIFQLHNPFRKSVKSSDDHENEDNYDDDDVDNDINSSKDFYFQKSVFSD